MSVRFFTESERSALFAAADGRCEECGKPLESGWHADHVEPFSRGGATDVVNGQALCPKCNIEKGASALRVWQREAMEKFTARKADDFLVSACPGSGKTRFALMLARRLHDEGDIQRIAVVVPTDALRQQWADEASAFGFHLMPVGEAVDYEKAGYDGCVLTYQQLGVGNGSLLLRRAMRIPTLAIIDEIHHAGDNRAWGQGLTNALTPARHRLALTGTPWRRDKREPIPFVTYNSDGQVHVDYPYKYGDAVSDGVCRGIVFESYDSEVRWTDCGTIVTAQLGSEDLVDENIGVALDAAYNPSMKWIPDVLSHAIMTLDDLRLEVPDAAGLVVADTQWLADAYGRLLNNMGRRAVVVTSDDPNAKAALDRFRTSRDPWIVAVKMVSEGVDIPRLAVGVYASKTRTPLFFRQVVGRLVRTRPGEQITAKMFLPAIGELVAHAKEIEDELRHRLDLDREEYEKVRDEDGSQRTLNFRESLSASEAMFDRSIFGGNEYAADELAAAREHCRAQGMSETYAPNVAAIIRTVSTVHSVHPVHSPPPVKSRHRYEQGLRTEIEKVARRVANKAGIPNKEVNAKLLRLGFPRRNEASVEKLEATLAYVVQWENSL